MTEIMLKCFCGPMSRCWITARKRAVSPSIESRNRGWAEIIEAGDKLSELVGFDLMFRLPRLLSLVAPFAPLLTRPFSAAVPAQLMRKCTGKKLKTHKGAAKRWLTVANGAFKRVRSSLSLSPSSHSRSLAQMKTGRVHLNGHISPARLNRLGRVEFARPIQKKLLRRLMPYA